MTALGTERLLLREWREKDLAPFADLNADPVVMEHLPSLLTREQSDALVRRHQAGLAAGRPGLFAVERRDTGAFIGFIGLAVPAFEAAFTPCVEIGWRLAAPAWGHGFATEGARAVLAHAFETLEVDEVVSFTARANLRSQTVMKRIGMRTDPAENFDHPSLPEGHPLRPHVLYRRKR